MKQRMNLFRQLTSAPAKSAKTLSAPQIKFKPGFHSYLAIGVVSVCGLGALATYSSHRASIKASQAALLTAQDQLKGILVQTEAVAAEIAKIKSERAKSRDAASKGIVADQDSFEDNWVSLLWKLSSLTGTGIVISNMELTKAAGPGGTRAARAVSLNGSALTLVTVRDWLDRLTKEVPGYDFSIESQSASGDAKYPVAFRVTARVI